MTRKGLYCAAGNFYIDPSGAVDNAVITHAHADHARRGSKQYFCVRSGVSLLKQRIGKNISVKSFAYGEKFAINGVEVSFHPAGHILGSSQVRVKYLDEVWVASGDYKRDPDPTCEPFEVVPCDVFVTEATFGTPGFAWPKDVDLGKEIFDWWSTNAEKGINSVLFAYSLGKAQRVLGVLEPYAEKPIYCHTTVTPLNECYRAQGVKLAPTRCLSTVEEDRVFKGELFLVPQSFLKTEKAELLGKKYETAFASGWMAGGGYGYSYDHGFVMSDHADWNDLLMTIKQTGAKRVYVQHRGNGALVRHLKSLGIQAYPDSELFPKDPDQLTFF
jgi:putative mRNA 3-end processing factor